MAEADLFERRLGEGPAMRAAALVAQLVPRKVLGPHVGALFGHVFQFAGFRVILELRLFLRLAERAELPPFGAGGDPPAREGYCCRVANRLVLLALVEDDDIGGGGGENGCRLPTADVEGGAREPELLRGRLRAVEALPARSGILAMIGA